MIQNQIIQKQPNESNEDFIDRIMTKKDLYGLTWIDVAKIINTECNLHFGPDKYRKDSYKTKYSEPVKEEEHKLTPEDFDIFTKVKLAKIQASDERIQANALYRKIAREESIKEIAREAAETSAQYYPMLPYKCADYCLPKEDEAILELSDWHYGIEIDSPYNRYNPEVARSRVAHLRDEVVRVINDKKITLLHVVNLGDLIAGRIHLELRINSRIDTITQIMEVSELLAEFLYDIMNECKGCKLEYYSTLDNHSRVEPNKKDSIELESLARITDWYLKSRFENLGLPIHFNSNPFGPDIITFKAWNHNVVAVHGDKDKPSEVVERLSLMTKDYYDLCLTAHLHHFSANEINQTVIVSNGSVMGTDAFAQRLRLSATPSQNLIIVSPSCACKEIIRIVF